MKGLLIKDLQMTFQNKKLLAVVLLLVLMLTLSKDEYGASFVISFVTMFCGVLVLNTISTDEFDKSIVFLMTMPIDKTLYVVEKYVFAFGCGFFGGIVSSVFCMIFMKLSVVEILAQAVLIFLILSLFQMIILPIQLKFGSDIGRIVLVGMAVCFVLLVNVASKIGGNGLTIWIEEGFRQGVQWLNSYSKWLIYVIGGLAWIGCLFLSVLISKSVMKKREF